ncbi:Low-density lipoprotein receptor-related protein 2, partial [Trichinella pseudospiralis]
LLQEWVCDHEYDCGLGDTSDEHDNCAYPKCHPTQFTCTNKQCLSMSYVCDGYPDCGTVLTSCIVILAACRA